MNRTRSQRQVVVGLVAGLACLPTLAAEHQSQGQLLDAGGLPALIHDTLGVRERLEPLPPRTVIPPGSYALSIDGAFDLGGYVFKEGYPFLHNDGGAEYGNTALGLDALISSTPGVPYYFNGRGNTALGFGALRDNTTGSRNTASGVEALSSNTTGYCNTANGQAALTLNTTGHRNTATGYGALRNNTTGYVNTATGYGTLLFNTTGYRNTANGDSALLLNTEGSLNTATGSAALVANTTGDRNTASGFDALGENTTGSRNTGLGALSGVFNSTGSDNIFIASYGANESNTLRIGNGTGTGYLQQDRAFISGIRGITTGEKDAMNVMIDSNGQLGTMSSSRRFKEDIHDMGGASAGLAELRPVTFRYRKAFDDGEKPVRYGLIAEEVAEVFPELVAYDEEGRPEAVLDHLLVPMLLNELQKLQREGVMMRASHDELLAHVKRLEKMLAEAPRLAAERSSPARR